MATDSDNVRVAATGGVFVAPTSTTLPTTSEAVYDAGFDEVGLISEDGVVEAYDDTKTDIKAWQNGATVRTLISGTTMTLQWTMIESNAVSLPLYHKGAAITGTSGAAALAVTTALPDRRAFSLDVIDGDFHTRIVVPNGEVSDRGDITYKNDEAIAYEVTITAYPDDSGNLAYKYSDDPAWIAA